MTLPSPPVGVVERCPWCEGQTKRFQMKTTDGEIVEMVEHQGWPHCCVRRDSMTLAQWNARVVASDRDVLVGRIAELEATIIEMGKVAEELRTKLAYLA